MGEVDCERLVESWQALMAIHPVLRSYFDLSWPVGGSEGVCVCIKRMKVPFKLVDLTSQPPNAFERLCLDEWVRGIDLNKGSECPLFRVRIVKIEEEQWKMVTGFISLHLVD